MQHLSDEQLVLYHYAEPGVDRGAATAHLAACESCRRSYESLQAVLGGVDTAPIPERPATYGRMVWARIAPQLEPQARWWQFRHRAPRRTAAAATVVVLVAAAFLAGRFGWRSARETPAARTAPADIQERILLVAVGDHLDRSQMVLVELANAQGSGALDISAERQWADELLGANRLYRLTAAGAGDTAVADLLEELEPFLVEIAHSPKRLSSHEVAELRDRMERQGILFKVRVVRSQIEREAT